MSIKISKLESREYSKAEFDKKGDIIKAPRSSYLKLKLSGNDITEELINSIRRTILQFIPTYAFTKELIDITTNTTNLNNDQIKLRISQMPIFDISNDIDHLDHKYWNIDYSKEYDKHKKDNKKIELFIKAKNAKNEIMNITSDEAEFYVNDKQVKYKKTDPLLIAQLSPKSELVCHAKAAMGIGFKNDIWSSGQCHFYEEDDGFVMVIRSYGQFTEKDMLKKACAYLKENCLNIEKQIKQSMFPENKNNYIITLENEDFTCACIINYYIQNNDVVKSSGVVRENHNIDSITFKIELESSSISKVFSKAINDVLAIYKKFEDAIAKI